MTGNRQWLSIIGIEEDGIARLSPEAKVLINEADLIFAGVRHLKMLGETAANQRRWATPFSASIDEIKAARGTNVVVLASGDPQWFGVGTTLARHFDLGEMRIIPARSAFSLAANTLGWPLADVCTLSLHGLPFANLARFIHPRVRLLILSKDGSTPGRIAEFLSVNGFGDSRMWVLEHLGGEKERILKSFAAGFDVADIASLNTVAVECVAGQGADWQATTAGLSDEAYEHDGQLTKQAVRAATLSVLRPFPGALLWDIGAGCGSIAIEWMRAAPNARAIAVEQNTQRCSLIRKNAAALGVPGLKLIEGAAPAALAGLPGPDAIFIGGGIMAKKMFENCYDALGDGGTIVANTVTLEGESRLGALHAEYGGELARIRVEHCTSIGSFRGWRQTRPVTRWRLTKRRSGT